jgi:tRNA(Ile2) C34 agmatinyltransferase TiaS
MKVFFGFDDTDNQDSLYGTGKLVRWFQKKLPAECACIGIVRQQLFVCDAIPFTSHNSAACLILEIPDPALLDAMVETAVAHIEQYAAAGSDPGLCVAAEHDRGLRDLVDFGQQCTHVVCTQKEAIEAAGQAHLSGHGGTNDGIIGAAAAVGLTISGWSGRYIEFGNLRDWPEQTSVSELRRSGIQTLSIDREAKLPAPHDIVLTKSWLRPRLMGHRPVLLVKPGETSGWENIDRKRRKKDHPAIQKRGYSEGSS